VAWATLVLLAANVFAFVVEVLRGGSTSFETLWGMGGMLPSAVGNGEWGRLFLGTVLHYGPLHLAMNMVALLILGPFVERSLGWMRYVVVYVLAGVGAMYGIVVLTRLGVHPDELVVGASGSVMGLIGATGAVLLRGWARERAREAQRRLGFVAFVVVFQVAFDLTTPDISFVGHAGGLIVGFIAASLVRHPAAEGQPRAS
jgi:rhomboid protease GluP